MSAGDASRATVHVVVRVQPDEPDGRQVWGVFASRELADQEVGELERSTDVNVRLYAGERAEIEEHGFWGKGAVITDEMVERACDAYNDVNLGDELAVTPAMRAALEAALRSYDDLLAALMAGRPGAGQ